DTRLLKDKRIVITGAGSGIGRAAAIRFAAAGARVAAVDVDAQGAAETARLVHAQGAEALALHADVSVEADVARAVEAIVATWGGLDVAVANAGIELNDEDARAHELELAVWQRTLDVNLTGVFLTCKHALRALLREGGGAIVCTASPTGLYGCAPGLDAYSASKAGVYG